MRRLLAAIAMLCGVLLAPAQAADSVTVQLTEITPNWLNSAKDVNLHLAVKSNSDFDVSFEISVSNEPLIGRSQIADAMANRLDLPSMNVSTVDAAVTTGVTSVDAYVPSYIWNARKTGVYVISVTRQGQAKPSLQVLLPLMRGKLPHPIQLVTLLPLTSEPTLLGDHRYSTLASLSNYTSSGSLISLLRGAQSSVGVTWLLDPDVVITAQSLVDGGMVLGDNNSEVAGDITATANEFLTLLPQTTAKNSVFLLPFANADVNGLLQVNRAGLAAAALRQTSATRALLGRADLASAVTAARGDLDDATWKWLQTQSISLRVLKDKEYVSSMNSATATGVVVAPDGANALVVDGQASRYLSSAMNTGTDTTAACQAYFSDLLTLALEQPSLDRVVVVQPHLKGVAVGAQATTNALRASSLPWVTATATADALRGTPPNSRERQHQTFLPAFNASYVETISKIEKRRRAVATLIKGSVHDERLLQAELRLTSPNFPSTHARQSLRTHLVAEMASIENAVAVVSAGSVMFPSESSVVPVTIRNNLDVDVTLEVVTSGIPAVRVQSEPIGSISIEAGKRKSLEIKTKLSGSDIAYVRVQLRTTDGHWLGSPKLIQIASSAYSRAAAWVVWAAFGLLLLLIAVNTVRRIRVHRRDKRLAARGE